uniref:Uncharacterized protein n=1 Tax=viral metagenome TaxID=1070528 RepID=A0A6C0LNN7_9ZZZZ
MNYETIFYDTLAVINIALFAAVGYIQRWALMAYEFIKNYDYEGLGLKIAFYYGMVKQLSIDTYNTHCKKGGFVDIAGENLSYFMKCLHASILSYRIEPLEPEWISVSCIYQTELDKATLNYSYNENYEEFPVFDTNEKASSIKTDSRLKIFTQWFYTTQHVMKQEKMLEECLLTMKSDNKYIYKICNRENECFTDLPNELSKIKFLNIEYSHPENNSSITIQLDRNAYLVGNEILSSAFVKRQLEYMNSSKNFDMTYVLKIMDNNLNNFELKSDEYIVLDKMEYKVMNKNKLDDWVELSSQDGTEEPIETNEAIETDEIKNETIIDNQPSEENTELLIEKDETVEEIETEI